MIQTLHAANRLGVDYAKNLSTAHKHSFGRHDSGTISQMERQEPPSLSSSTHCHMRFLSGGTSTEWRAIARLVSHPSGIWLRLRAEITRNVRMQGEPRARLLKSALIG